MANSDRRQQFMNQNQQQKQPEAGQIAYPTTYQTAPVGTVSSPIQPPATFVPQQPLPYQTQHFRSQQQQQLQTFWANQMQEIERTTDFRNHSLPLARIKKIMKADQDVRMISAEAPVVFAKACEMFILELTRRSWIHTEENKRRTLQKNDIVAAISGSDAFDFLVDVIPRDELKEEALGLVGSPTDVLAYCYVPQARPSMPFMAWPQSHGQQPPAQQQQSDSYLEG